MCKGVCEEARVGVKGKGEIDEKTFEVGPETSKEEFTLQLLSRPTSMMQLNH